MQLVKKIEMLAKESASAEGVDFYHLDFRKTGKSWLLRVYIDRKNGVSLSDCEKVSIRLGAKLEIDDPIAGPYKLEVSSPGLDRPLVKEEHFHRQIGKAVEIRTFMPVEGKKYFKGKLMECDESSIKIELDNSSILIPFEAVAKANLVIEI